MLFRSLGRDQCYYTPYHTGENLLRVWGAYEGETLLGCVAFRWKAQGLGELKRLFVRPEYRGQGVAQALMAHSPSPKAKAAPGSIWIPESAWSPP